VRVSATSCAEEPACTLATIHFMFAQAPSVIADETAMTAFGPGRKHSLLPALAKNMPPAYFLNASRPPGGSLTSCNLTAHSIYTNKIYKNMKKTITKITSIILILAAMLSITACKGPISDDEARQIAKELLEKEVVLTAYVYGDEYKLASPSEFNQHKDDTSYYYSKVSKESPYTTKQQLIDAINAVYTERAAEEVLEFAINGNSSDDGASIIPRFYQGADEDRLKIDVTSYGIYQLSTVVILDTLTVKRSTKNMMEVTVSYKAGESGNTREMDFIIRRENDQWKLDTRTWAVGVE